MSAKEGLLGTLHEKITQKYIDILNGAEEVTAAHLNAINKFLKDNGIECEAGDAQMGELTKVAGNVTKFPFQVNES